MVHQRFAKLLSVPYFPDPTSCTNPARRQRQNVGRYSCSNRVEKIGNSQNIFSSAKIFLNVLRTMQVEKVKEFRLILVKNAFFLFSPFLLRRGKTSLQQDKAHGPALRTDRQQSAILFYPRVAFTCQPRFCTPILKFGGNSEPFIFK